MNQEKYIGMDVHTATISTAVMNGQGKLLTELVTGHVRATVAPVDYGFRSRVAGR